MEHSLLGSELGDGREDTASVAREEDDVGWVVVANTGDLCVLDVLDGVGTNELVSIDTRNDNFMVRHTIVCFL
jgi:hypothetical protein